MRDGPRQARQDGVLALSRAPLLAATGLFRIVAKSSQSSEPAVPQPVAHFGQGPFMESDAVPGDLRMPRKWFIIVSCVTHIGAIP